MHSSLCLNYNFVLCQVQSFSSVANKKTLGSGSTTCHRRFQEWVLSNVFQKLWVRLLKLYDDLRGIKWKWQSLDSISVKAPLGGEMTGWSKSYRQIEVNKAGTKRHVLYSRSKRHSIIS